MTLSLEMSAPFSQRVLAICRQLCPRSRQMRMQAAIRWSRRLRDVAVAASAIRSKNDNHRLSIFARSPSKSGRSARFDSLGGFFLCLSTSRVGMWTAAILCSAVFTFESMSCVAFILASLPNWESSLPIWRGTCPTRSPSVALAPAMCRGRGWLVLEAEARDNIGVDCMRANKTVSTVESLDGRVADDSHGDGLRQQRPRPTRKPNHGQSGPQLTVRRKEVKIP